MKTHYGNCDVLMEAYQAESVIEGKYNTEDVEFDGAEGVYVDELVTYPLQDYDMDAAGDRYGTAHEVDNRRQLILLDYDKAYNLTVDKRNLNETGLKKRAARVVEEQYKEQVVPYFEERTLSAWAKGAGYKVASASAPTSGTVLDALMAIEVAFDNKRVPKTERFCAVRNSYMPAIRSALINCDEITDRMLIKGIVGKIGTLMIMPTPDGDMPDGCFLLAWQKKSVIAPKTIKDAKVHIDPPGLSGAKMEGRFRGTARVLGKRAHGAYALISAAAKATAPSSPAKGSTYTTFTLASNHTAKFTLDGSDPRYSITAKDYSATAIPNPAAGTVIKIYALASDKYDSDVVEHTCV